MGILRTSCIVLVLSILIAYFMGHSWICKLLSSVIPPCMLRALHVHTAQQTLGTEDATLYDGSTEYTPLHAPLKNGKIFTKAELKQYDGSEGSPGVAIAIMGHVFDVSKGIKHYGPGGGYSFFAAKDGTRAFVTGEFTEEGLTDDTQGLTPQQASELHDWLNFYYKDYSPLGVVEGTFFNSNGQPQQPLSHLAQLVREAQDATAAKQADEKKFPPCNSQWSQTDGTTLWCSDKSGGVERDWAGVPRQYLAPGSKSTRCACIRTTGPPADASADSAHSNRGDLDNPKFKIYEGCDPLSPSCKLIKK